MSVPNIQISIARSWQPEEVIFLLGPGGVGKSTLGRALVAKLGWRLIDLDLVFCDEIGNIGAFIVDHGYARYRSENLALAQRLVAGLSGPCVFVTSSGFLAEAVDRKVAEELIGGGFGIVLLPSLDIKAATDLVVERQMARGLGAVRELEGPKFRKRYRIYWEAGDMQVISISHPDKIAAEIIALLMD